MPEHTKSRYVEFAPRRPLQPFVSCIWILDGWGNPAAGGQPVFPDGCAELVVHFGDPFSVVDTSESRQPHGLLVGQIERAIHLREGRRVGVIGARLRPAAAGRVLRQPAVAVTGSAAELSAFAGADGGRFVARVNEARTDAKRVAAVEAFLLSRIQPERLPDRRIDAAVNLLRTNGGNLRVDRVAHEVAISPRQFQRLFAHEVGLRAKQYARIVRFQRALGCLQAGRALTDTALRCGYHDHAHFTREFRTMAGLAPSQFLHQRAPLAGHFIDDLSDSYKTQARGGS